MGAVAIKFLMFYACGCKFKYMLDIILVLSMSRTIPLYFPLVFDLRVCIIPWYKYPWYWYYHGIGMCGVGWHMVLALPWYMCPRY